MTVAGARPLANLVSLVAGWLTLRCIGRLLGTVRLDQREGRGAWFGVNEALPALPCTRWRVGCGGIYAMELARPNPTTEAQLFDHPKPGFGERASLDRPPRSGRN